MSLGKKLFHQNPADSSGSGAASAQQGLVLHLDANDEDSIESGGGNQGNGSGTWFDISRYNLNVPLVDKSSNLQLHLNASDTTSYSGIGDDWTDISQNSNTATKVNGPTYGSDLRGYFDMDGSDDIFEIDYNASLYMTSNTGFTIEAWVNRDSDAEGYIIASRDNSNYPYALQWNSSSHGYYGWISGSTATSSANVGLSENSTNGIGNWDHVVMTHSSSDRKNRLYVNGTLTATSSTVTGVHSTSSNVYIGAYWQGAVKFDGKIGVVRIYNTELTASEVGQNFRAGNFISYTSIITSKDSATQGNLITAPPTQGTIHSTNLALSLDANGYTSGAWYNTANSSYNGTINGATYVNNDNSDYFDLDGSDDFIEVNTYAGVDIGSGGLTVEVWALCEGTSGTDTIVSNIGSDLYGYQLVNNGTNVILYIYENTNVIVNETASSSIVVGTWNHYVFTVASNSNGAEVKVYINGKEKIDSTLNSAYSGSSTNFNIGKYPYAASNRYFEGKIGQVRTYTSALTQSQVNTNYNATKDLYQGVTSLQLSLDANGYTSGNWSDTSGNSRHAVISGNTAHTNDNNSDYFTLDGTGDYFTVAHNNIFNLEVDNTIEMWIWRSSTTNEQTLMHKGESWSSGNAWFLNWTSSLNAGYYFYDYDTASETKSGLAATPLNEWHHLVLSWNAGTRKAKMYINGVEPSYQTAPTDGGGSLGATNTDALEIGKEGVTGTGHPAWNGRIAQVRWYKGAMTELQANTNYDATKALYQNPTIHMNLLGSAYTSGSTWTDSSGNGNDGEITNGTALFDKELGNYLNFDGSPRLTVSSFSELQTATAFTIEFWLRSSTATSDGMIWNVYDSSSSTRKFSLSWNSNKLRWVVYSATGGYNASQDLFSSNTFSTNTWLHITATYNFDNEMKIYVDGVLEGEESSPNLGVNTTTTTQMRWSDRSDGYSVDTQIGEARFYSAALTSAQVAQNYLATKKYYPNENHATNNGANFYGSSTPYYFDFISNDYFRTSSIPITWTSGFAYEIYFKADTNTQSYPISTSGSTNPALSWRNMSGWKIVAFHYKTNGTPDYLQSDANATGQWYHIVYTANDSGGQIYTNGSLSDSTTNSVKTGNYNDYFDIGRLGGGNYLDGKIGMIKIHAKHLTSTEVSANYDATKSTYGLS
tara:strand:+ start:18178 stop:21651 length:3474 start_codon:yes stop_codon:yes gene_type:complete